MKRSSDKVRKKTIYSSIKFWSFDIWPSSTVWFAKIFLFLLMKGNLRCPFQTIQWRLETMASILILMRTRQTAKMIVQIQIGITINSCGYLISSWTLGMYSLQGSTHFTAFPMALNFAQDELDNIRIWRDIYWVQSNYSIMRQDPMSKWLRGFCGKWWEKSAS